MVPCQEDGDNWFVIAAMQNNDKSRKKYTGVTAVWEGYEDQPRRIRTADSTNEREREDVVSLGGRGANTALWAGGEGSELASCSDKMVGLVCKWNPLFQLSLGSPKNTWEP